MVSCSGTFADAKNSNNESYFSKFINFLFGENKPKYATLPRDTDFAEPSIYDSHSAQLADYSFLFTQMTNWNNFYQTYENALNKNHFTPKDYSLFTASVLKNTFKIATNVGLDGLFTYYKSQKFPNESRFSGTMFIQKEILPLLLQFSRICWFPLSKLTKSDIQEAKKVIKELLTDWNQV